MNGIKKGDQVICIDNRLSDQIGGYITTDLTIGKVYIILEIVDFSTSSNYYRYIRVLDDVGVSYGYYEYRFATLKEYRLLKLCKLNSINS